MSRTRGWLGQVIAKSCFTVMVSGFPLAGLTIHTHFPVAKVDAAEPQGLRFVIKTAGWKGIEAFETNVLVEE